MSVIVPDAVPVDSSASSSVRSPPRVDRTQNRGATVPRGQRIAHQAYLVVTLGGSLLPARPLERQLVGQGGVAETYFQRPREIFRPPRN